MGFHLLGFHFAVTLTYCTSTNNTNFSQAQVPWHHQVFQGELVSQGWSTYPPQRYSMFDSGKEQ